MIINNVKMVLQDEIVTGCLSIEDGKIADISSSTSQLSHAIDGLGAYLLPGLIELHTDNLEKFFTPRPKVSWPGHSAMASHDALMIASGITTVLDAVALGYINDDGARLHNLERMLDTIIESDKNGDNRAQHLLHLRCELPHQDTVSVFEQLVDKGPVAMVSLMDHSPGQRQFTNKEKYRTYYMGKYGLDAQEMLTFEAEQIAASEKWSTVNRFKIAAAAKQRGIALASHDDATLEHALESSLLGCAVAEFPTTVEAAKASHEQGMQVLMGAPNIVRGGSHSGNVAAADLAKAGVLDILSSDYYPASLLDAAFQVSNMQDNPYNLCDAINMVSLNPANTLGLKDRGSITIGKRADLVLAKENRDRLGVVQVWREAQRVF